MKVAWFREKEKSKIVGLPLGFAPALFDLGISLKRNHSPYGHTKDDAMIKPFRYRTLGWVEKGS